ncbi:hypothetical protein SAMN05421644_1576 [Allochromatium warmingii]|uniref:DUF4136 domain-containing protein n=1 Tax=Allochromatium warmingii TaxID=61595 RepID=A0A1H3JEP8_ALLWA|nr:hypothetical protein [Allochromatium warmingii]SDY38406.1 hypothetical protein SAMN05421644_1576 [Allochromatium warmingii]
MLLPVVIRPVLIALAAIVLTACASSPVSSVWTSPNQSLKGYERLVVFGITNSPKVRRAYEDQFVAQLQARNVQVRAGYELVADRNLGRLARVTEGYAQIKADAVIITHLVTDEQPAIKPEARLETVPNHYRHLIGYYSKVHEDVCAPDYYRDLKSLRLEANVYDAKREQLVWSGRSQPLDPHSEKTTIGQVVEEIVEQMQRDGVLKQ